MTCSFSGPAPYYLHSWSAACSHGTYNARSSTGNDLYSAEDFAIIEALRQRLKLCGTHDYALHCPRAAPSVGVVACTYHHWFEPFSQQMQYCQLPVSGRRMQRFLQFRLGSHQLPIVLGRFAGGQHVARVNRVCTHCGRVAVADELHMIFECPALQAVRQRYAPLFSTGTNTMRSCSAQQYHMQVFKFFLDFLDVFHI